MGFYSRSPQFELGKLLVSPGVIDSGIDYQHLLRRHLSGDWGDVCEYDTDANRRAVETGDAILSQYRVMMADGGLRSVCIMTETGRTHTVVFFLDENPVANETD